MNTVRFIRGLGSFNLRKGPVSLNIANYGCGDPKIEIRQVSGKPLSVKFNDRDHQLMLKMLSDEYMIRDLEKFNEESVKAIKEDLTTVSIEEMYQKKFDAEPTRESITSTQVTLVGIMLISIASYTSYRLGCPAEKTHVY
tara:strand:- start:25464 stop:25883 length:420 start_codon:yes stop_codon:yes gene_type:complete